MNSTTGNVDIARPANPLQWPLAIGLVLLTVVLGGYLSGCAVYKWGSLGAVSLWALGGLAGWIAAKVLSPHRQLGYALAASVVLAFLVAEVCWIHWKIIGADTWPEAVKMLPLFFQEYQLDALMGGLWTFFGAASAYRQAGFRYKYVRVVDS